MLVRLIDTLKVRCRCIRGTNLRVRCIRPRLWLTMLNVVRNKVLTRLLVNRLLVRLARPLATILLTRLCDLSVSILMLRLVRRKMSVCILSTRRLVVKLTLVRRLLLILKIVMFRRLKRLCTCCIARGRWCNTCRRNMIVLILLMRFVSCRLSLMLTKRIVMFSVRGWLWFRNCVLFLKSC